MEILPAMLCTEESGLAPFPHRGNKERVGTLSKMNEKKNLKQQQQKLGTAERRLKGKNSAWYEIYWPIFKKIK